MKRCMQGSKHKLILLPPSDIDSVQRNLVPDDKDYLNQIEATLCTHQLHLNYNVWSAQQVIRAILPDDIEEVTTSFETVGHIAHVNLRDSQLDYKHVIGQVLLDKNNPHIRTVVNKLSDIQETYRFFKMEVLAGSDDMIATVRENGCMFTFDFSQVYWNSRLHTEHSRIIDSLTLNDVVCDLFAGVGPFALPAGKKGCMVYANDLNPAAYQALCNNVKINRVESRIRAYNLDGRDFVKKVMQEIQSSHRLIEEQEFAKHNHEFQHSIISPMFTCIVMNLPATAIKFLDIFQGLLKGLKNVALPTIYCYCFSKAPNPEEDARQQCEHMLGTKIEANVHRVRDVAPNKVMLCVQFKLPHVVAFKTSNDADSDAEGKLQ